MIEWLLSVRVRIYSETVVASPPAGAKLSDRGVVFLYAYIKKTTKEEEERGKGLEAHLEKKEKKKKREKIGGDVPKQNETKRNEGVRIAYVDLFSHHLCVFFTSAMMIDFFYY